jgi:hypothetical protein
VKGWFEFALGGLIYFPCNKFYIENKQKFMMDLRVEMTTPGFGMRTGARRRTGLR